MVGFIFSLVCGLVILGAIFCAVGSFDKPPTKDGRRYRILPGKCH